METSSGITNVYLGIKLPRHHLKRMFQFLVNSKYIKALSMFYLFEYDFEMVGRHEVHFRQIH